MSRKERIEEAERKRKLIIFILKEIKEKQNRTLNAVVKKFLEMEKIPLTYSNYQKTLGLVHYHLNKLVEDGKVRKERDGRATIYTYLGE